MCCISSLNLAGWTSELPFKRYDPNTPLILAGPLRLAKKYDMEGVRARLVKHVTADWPVTLIEWDRQLADFEAIEMELLQLQRNNDENSPRQFLSDHIPEPASAIAFAREFGCSEILPAAFYRLAVTPIDHDWDPHYETNDALYDNVQVARWSRVSAEDLRCMLRGLSDLRSRWKFYVPDQILASHCTSDQCIARLDQLLRPLAKHAPSDTYDLLELLKLLLQRDTPPDFGLCSRCIGSWHEWLRDERKEVWSSLSQAFHLD